MNCKPGELCYVIAHPHVPPPYKAKFVTTVRLITEDWFVVPCHGNPNVHEIVFDCRVEPEMRPLWLCDATIHLGMGMTGYILQAPIGDRFLRPIRGDLSGDDENIDRPIDTPLPEHVLSGHF